MLQSHIKKLSLTILATLVTGVVMAQGLPSVTWNGPKVPYRATENDAAAAFFYNNFFADVCTTCNYDNGLGGYVLLGPSNCDPNFPGLTEWLAYKFVSLKTGVPRKITAAITLDSACTSPNSFTLGIYTDACSGGASTGPGTALVSGVAKAATAPCSTTVLNLRNAPSLTAGTTYWVVATTASTQTLFTGVWWFTNEQGAYNLNDATGWHTIYGSFGAFSVQ